MGIVEILWWVGVVVGWFGAYLYGCHVGLKAGHKRGVDAGVAWMLEN